MAGLRGLVDRVAHETGADRTHTTAANQNRRNGSAAQCRFHISRMSLSYQGPGRVALRSQGTRSNPRPTRLGRCLALTLPDYEHQPEQEDADRQWQIVRHINVCVAAEDSERIDAPDLLVAIEQAETPFPD